MVTEIRSQTGSQRLGQTEERQKVLDALKEGNIYEVLRNLPEGVSAGDIQDYFRGQGAYYHQLLQDTEQSFAHKASMPAPDPSMFVAHESGVRLTEEEQKELALALEGMASPRAMNIKGAGNVRAEHVEGEQDAAHAGTPLSKEELQDLQKRTKNDVESTLFELMDRVYDQQMMSDYKRRMAEIKKEIEIAKRSGNPALIIVALTKKVMLKKGIYMSRIGKEMALTNEKLNKIQEDLGTSTDVKDLSKAQADTRQENFSLNQLTSDFQSLVQGVASDLEFAQSTVQDYFRTSNEISRKVSGQG